MINAIVIFSVEICIAANCIYFNFFTLEIYMLAFFAAACSISCFEQLQLHKCDEQGRIHGYPSRVGVGRSSAGEGR